MYNRLLQISPPVVLGQQRSCYSFLWGCIKIILLLKNYSPLWTLASIQSSTISSDLWPLPACFSFPLYLSLLLCYLSIFCLIIIFFLFLPFWHKIYFWKQNNGHDNSVEILKILMLSLHVKSIPCCKENNICALQQNVPVIQRYQIHISQWCVDHGHQVAQAVLMVALCKLVRCCNFIL